MNFTRRIWLRLALLGAVTIFTLFTTPGIAQPAQQANTASVLAAHIPVKQPHTRTLVLPEVHTARVAKSRVSARPARQWYGWQTLTADGVAYTLLGLALASEEEEVLPPLAVGTFLLGGPLVHIGHGQWLKAGASLGLRGLVPLVGAAVYSSQDCYESTYDEPRWCMRNLLTGVVTLFAVAGASAVDGAFLAWEPRKPEPLLVPLASASARGAWLGVSGRF
jgi:hypothetical protein